jgi:hypothetical protein
VLIESDPEKFSDTMLASAKETAEKATRMVVKQKMKEIIPALSLAYIIPPFWHS